MRTIDDIITSHAIPIDLLLIGNDILEQSLEIIASYALGKQVALITDVNTFEAYGQQIEQSLAKSHTLIPIHFPSSPEASMEVADTIIAQTAQADFYVVVGGGTLNDLCKYVSYKQGKPYIVYGTAPSMNGYVSANASLSQHGYKQSLKAHLPKALFFDLEVLASAPKRLIQSGFGDALCRTTAQVDWLLSHQLLERFYDEEPFALLAPYEAQLLDAVPGLLKGDQASVRALLENLIVSGLGMALAKGSYPASQGEHMIAHTMEMAFGNTLPQTYHGEQIAVTTMTMSAIQEKVMDTVPEIRPVDADSVALVGFFGKAIAKDCVTAYNNKRFSEKECEELNQHIADNWHSWVQVFHSVKIPHDQLTQLLETMEAPLSSSAIGWQEEAYQQAVRFAPFTRDRFTFLDLAMM